MMNTYSTNLFVNKKRGRILPHSLQEKRNRRIEIEGASNIRDLGGYFTKDGKRTKWGKYVRSDSLHKLPIKSQNSLREYGVRYVVDLRYPEEGTYQLEEQLNIKYWNVPLHNPAEVKVEKITTLVDLYCRLIDNRQQEIYQIMQHFINTEDKTVLFHCKAGKDRTGIIAALLLDLVGVPKETIIQDYAMTAEARELINELRKARPSYANANEYEALLQCRPEFMEEFLHYLYKNYGNSEQYLQTIGLEKDELEEIKYHFIEE